MEYYGLKLSDALIIISTLLGPILAVQAQKAIERLAEARANKNKIFYTLMGTRLARASSEHIQALNSIPLVFGSKRFFGFLQPSRSEREIIEAWDSYLDILNTNVQGVSEATIANWARSRDDEFNNILLLMSTCLGHQFNKLKINKGVYSPISQALLERNQQDIIEGLARVFRSETSIPMHVVSIATDEEASQLNHQFQKSILDALNGEGIPIKVSDRVGEKGGDNVE
jgi:hypothetical protein